MANSSKVLLLLMSLGSMQQQGVLGATCMVLGSVTQPPKNGQAVFIASLEGTKFRRWNCFKRDNDLQAENEIFHYILKRLLK